eukprot:CAMPEP_0175832260 /NCGR_PEP_ID=MMETSP0107_2-20121207/14891_1 /TAXON_ID=195067 ORGANISM="Goniomonas pacifica, Strain CCMP1869" /NCGR_SAMPLE_ID=MMETSP0107_2 /ASSEMBLY_ACC=CAM_ASM_000203 /LENGTH=117 /DNA_ID=CAMNT_0017145329 /DNA_START=83 /DNA_END=437 /DNA_ORIENTATION=+
MATSEGASASTSRRPSRPSSTTSTPDSTTSAGTEAGSPCANSGPYFAFVSLVVLTARAIGVTVWNLIQGRGRNDVWNHDLGQDVGDAADRRSDGDALDESSHDGSSTAASCRRSRHN